METQDKWAKEKYTSFISSARAQKEHGRVGLYLLKGFLALEIQYTVCSVNSNGKPMQKPTHTEEYALKVTNNELCCYVILSSHIF